MECPRCQTVAPEGAKFCMSCGSPMSAICPECGTELPAEARFCLNGGNQLPQAASQSASGSNQESPGAAGLEQYIPKKLLAKLEAARGSGGLQGERRLVTMLFCDVTGSTAAAEKLDPEEWAQIMNGVAKRYSQPSKTWCKMMPPSGPWCWCLKMCNGATLPRWTFWKPLCPWPIGV